MNSTIAARHIPVMARECVELMRPCLEHPGAVYVDATTGLGGHLSLVLEAYPHVRAVAIDRDPRALELARERVADDARRCHFVCTTYDRIEDCLAEAGYERADAILMDLGVSSMQLDERERGFSYARDAALDMRMDPTRGDTAADLLARADAGELARILATYGEERHAGRIARAIVAARGEAPVTTSARLVEIIRAALPQAAMRRGGNPAKRTFQALRIAVNDELDILERALPAAIGSLREGGRLVVESYHSLEDRLVKTAFRQATTTDLPADLPLRESERGVEYRLVHRGARKASAAEVEENSRSAPVRLRCLEKTDTHR
ncbi:16S rRNA (cytosine(1402)-N(4))-methyltransferase RsmH [Nanchangia anserum]|uniref:Ribosomal RNA small subunit methyltransferase H n=1 Tax=Nanchangia anserum TaxID=2692125 RepID=A0A8I0KPD8_9ACTO|nr:16S rRNA (cytosine(1402)-N(4))-methyltransferase RsmH [Nanchangia anserum]MBD3690246.1 16S rRNA (cytosine(1402)-N(4))-methyltransferase RsmH [Nanchangia anserum]QOX82312.1 16S rRNA (cytosine(1402)-N(4))-methyltransferase RsmH [Nanchangia anserum]